MGNKSVLDICKEGSKNWMLAFNSQDEAGCASHYNENSILEARPFGKFNGRKEIQAFWKNIIDQGFSDVEYTDSKWQESKDGGYLLSSKWSMNNAFGVVTSEHWVVEPDGKARLIYDEFEVLGER